MKEVDRKDFSKVVNGEIATNRVEKKKVQRLIQVFHSIHMGGSKTVFIICN